ncbi:MAG: glycosyltransferase family 2 protein [Ruminiclostridium sp.]|nr:glycosyltransferase family 2 protein [Ruminiclostridium sp.]
MNSFVLTLVIPVYQEANQLYENIHIIRNILNRNGISHEFILVDDGSLDKTWEVVKTLSKEIDEIRAIRLSRNFGKEAALCAGLEIANGDACVIMDADLQHPPEVIPQMLDLWQSQGVDIVDGIKSSRGKESFFKKISARSFYSILKRFSGLDLNNASDFKLLDSKVVSAWKRMGERTTFFRGMSAWVGFKRASVPFVVAERQEGKSKWSFLRLLKLAIIAITSFSSAPLQLVTFIGFLFLISSVILGVQTLYMKFMNISFSGFTTVILLLLIIGSTLMISLGIIGTYIARIFDEVKQRPRYIVLDRIDKRQEQEKHYLKE